MFNKRILVVAVASTLATSASAGVESLTSDEMVDTYIEDSAIIIVPRAQQKSEEERQRVIRSLTISPGEPAIQESEEEAYANIFRKSEYQDNEEALQDAEEEFIRRSLQMMANEAALAPQVADLNPTLPPLIYGQQMVIPDQPFTQTFLNDQLGIGFDGQNVNFSIGNLPGIQPINIPQGINEGPVLLTPRPGGGFDLSIAVPDQ